MVLFYIPLRVIQLPSVVPKAKENPSWTHIGTHALGLGKSLHDQQYSQIYYTFHLYACCSLRRKVISIVSSEDLGSKLSPSAHRFPSPCGSDGEP